MADHAPQPPARPTGSPPEVEVDPRVLDGIIVKEFGGRKENLIMILQSIQKEYGYLPEKALRHTAERLEVPTSHIYSVGTFYSTFSFVPKGRHVVTVCLGTACHVRGAQRVLDGLSKRLDIAPGETTADMRFSLETVRCVGCCSLGPVVRIGQDTHGRVGVDGLTRLVDQYE
ncbi:MAG: NADH-quinone oxidoreductase subunit NuoE [Proteobacteria bacterium]|nr:NADH-quinone oxidoreductase subunit NuoE [Pseudomonadota bacterium]MBU1742247.1 NADH-quinone oxidoreductase subunit NuoE [Pseudomonadota bacterium]